MNKIKHIILCADDFGQNEMISQGIIQLVQKKRVNAVSCMVNGAAWPKYAKPLAQTNVAAGLHLNFTLGHPLVSSVFSEFPSLLKLIILCYLPCALSQSWVKQEIKAQLLCFKQHFGRWPDFIDGHQHVHQLPIIRTGLLHVVKELAIKPWFRITYSMKNVTKGSWKAYALMLLGGQTWRNLLQEHDYSFPQDFSGDYSFHEKAQFPQILSKAMQGLSDGGLIMCHPALAGDSAQDSIAKNRWMEYQYLESEQFLMDSAQISIELMPRIVF
jgi:predicted glycoside hydrolase/deacetylase ChbG (UPF0249 family)